MVNKKQILTTRKYFFILISLIIIIFFLFSININESYAEDISGNRDVLDERFELKLNDNEDKLENSLVLNRNNVLHPVDNTFNSIQQAILQANPGDTILLDDKTYYGSGNRIYINKNVTILGSSKGKSILDGKNLSNIFYAQDGSMGSTIKNCIFINGNSTYGGAIFIQSKNILIEDCLFMNNLAYGGGAIRTEYDSIDLPDSGLNLIIKNCNFTNNHATVTAGAIGAYNNNTHILNCNFYSNSVYDISGPSKEVYGGAIQLGLDNKNYISYCDNCTFINNFASTKNNKYFAHGGAGCIRKGNIYKNCIFINNTADEGGALTFHSDGIVENCTFINNTAVQLYGGAMSTGWRYEKMKMIIKNCTFTGNNAPIGGAIQAIGENVEILNSIFTNNKVNKNGGAVYIKSISTSITNSQFKENIANINGGGVYIEGSNSKIIKSEFYKNEAIPNINNYNDGLGGAIYIKGAFATVIDNSFKFNTARNGSGIYFDKLGILCNISNNIMFNNQAWVYWLPIYVKDIYYGNQEHIEAVIYGGNNIGDVDNLGVSNAIYNGASSNNIYINGQNPLNSARDTGELYQDSREYNIKVLLTIAHEDGTVIFNKTLLTNVWGNISTTLNNLKPGKYVVKATHFEDTYYKGIVNTTTFNVIPQVDALTLKSSNDLIFNYLDMVTWTINITNKGPNNATGVVVHDLLPSGLVYVKDDSNNTYDPISGLWTVGNLAKGDFRSIKIICLINATGKFVNKAYITSNEYDWNLSNNNDSSSIFVNPASDLAIVKLVNNSNPNYGEHVLWTVIVKNNGPDDATGVIVRDILPEGIVLIDSSGGGSYINGLWTVGSLANGESRKLEIVCLVNRTGNFVNFVNVNSNEYDWNLSNNNDSSSVFVNPASDLAIVKLVNNSNPNYKSKILWTIAISNKGPDDATGVIVRDILPEGIVFLSDDSNNKYDFKSGLWTVGSLAKGHTYYLNIVCLVNSTGDFINLVSISGNEFDKNLSNNKDNKTIHVNDSADLAIKKTVSKIEYNINEAINYVIKVTNKGPNIAKNIKVKEIFESSLSLINFSSSKGKYNNNSNLWTIDSLDNGESAVLSLNAISKKVGIFNNSVKVYSDTFDHNLKNNFDMASVNIINNISSSTNNFTPNYSNKELDLKNNVKAISMKNTGIPILLLFILSFFVIWAIKRNN